MLSATVTPAIRNVTNLASQKPTVLLLMAGLILPNAFALVAGYWISTPSRATAIALYAALALLCHRMPLLLAILLYLLILANDVLNVVQQNFFMELEDVSTILGMGGRVDLLASSFYGGLLAALAAFVAVNLVVLALLRMRMRTGNRLVLTLAVSASIAVEMAANPPEIYGFSAKSGIGQPFEAGVTLSGFGDIAHASAPPRKVLMVVVESLGVLRDPRHRAILFSPLADPALRQRFAMTSGTTTFFGHTSHGEMRELCQSRSHYQTIVKGDDPICLPDLFAARGYETLSVHGFTGEFYERRAWYPRVGFSESAFPETFKVPYPRRCGSSFTGPCDVDIADRISTSLAEAKRPTFVYWLTLNSHVPVRPGQATRRHACEMGGPFGDPEVCFIVEIWQDLFASVARLALANPETEILMVGDHAPPLWRRTARAMFAPDRVPWIRLTPRNKVHAAR